MSSLRFEIDMKELQRALRKLGKEQSKTMLADAALQAAEIVSENVKRRAPDSGLARTSNRKKKKGKSYPRKLSEDVLIKEAKIDYRGVLVRIVSLPYYTKFVERGTSKQPPRPYMRRAAMESESAAQAKFKDGIEAMIKDAFR